MRCVECGHDVHVIAVPRKKSSRKVRRGYPRKIKGHDLCQRCFESTMDVLKARLLAEQLEEVHPDETTSLEEDGPPCKI